MLEIIAGLSEERSGAVSRRECRSGLIRSTESHVVPCFLCGERTGEIAVGHEIGTTLRVVDLLTEQERQVVVFLQRQAVVSRIGPYITQPAGVGNLGQWLGFILDTLLGQCSVEAAIVRPLQTDGSLRAKCQALNGLPIEGQSVRIGIGMLLQLVDRDVALRIGHIEKFLHVGIGIGRIHIAIFTHTVGRTVTEHVDDTARTHVVTTRTFITTESELRVELHLQVLGNLHVGLDVQVGATHARTEDDTLILTLGERDIELHLIGAAADGHVGRVVDRRLTHHLVLPVVGGQRVIHVQVVGVTEVTLEELGLAIAVTLCTVILELILSKLTGIHQVEFLREMADAEVAVEANLHATCLSALRRHHHNAITTLGTIDGSQGGIFQNVDRRNVRRRNIIDIVNLETIDNEKRLVFLRHRGAATNADVHICTWLTIDRGYLHTGNLTLQSNGSRSHGHHFQFLS